MVPNEDTMNTALDKIHDLAVEASAIEGTPAKVDAALDEIIALARYKFDVTPNRPKPE